MNFDSDNIHGRHLGERNSSKSLGTVVDQLKADSFWIVSVIPPGEEKPIVEYKVSGHLLEGWKAKPVNVGDKVRIEKEWKIPEVKDGDTWL